MSPINVSIDMLCRIDKRSQLTVSLACSAKGGSIYLNATTILINVKMILKPDIVFLFTTKLRVTLSSLTVTFTSKSDFNLVSCSTASNVSDSVGFGLRVSVWTSLVPDTWIGGGVSPPVEGCGNSALFGISASSLGFGLSPWSSVDATRSKIAQERSGNPE
jgi:hypothetical protein